MTKTNKQKHLRHEECEWRVLSYGKYDNPPMLRLYVRVKRYRKKREWIAIGWICPLCGKVVVEEEKLPLIDYKTAF